MFRWLSRKVKFITHQKKEESTTDGQRRKQPESQKVSTRLNKNFTYMKAQFGENYDIIYRSFRVGKQIHYQAFLMAVDGMVEKTTINLNIIKPLMQMDLVDSGHDLMGYLKDSVISVIDIKEEEDMTRVVNQVVNGKVALFIEGEQKALLIGVQAWEMRGIEEPVTETVVRGPRDGFIENLQTNLSLVRRRIHHPHLRMEPMTIGTSTQTKVVVSYIKDIANEEIVKEVKRRLEEIQVDAILETGFIEEYIEDAPFSFFPTVSNTEKPDIVAARLLEGRVAIFVDGTPEVLTVPNLLISAFQIAEDYYSRPFYVSFIRIIRILAFLSSIILPGLYIASQNFHTELIPTPLLITMAEAREGVPFPLPFEVLFLNLMFEWLKESGVRMPRPIGQAVSIVGALILGESAVAAGLVGAPTVIVIAMVGITSFLVPALSDTISLLRLLFILIASVFGLYGIILLGIVIIAHLASLRSFGIPYSAPMFPITFKDWKDAMVRLPLWMLVSRPKVLRPANLIRQKWGGWVGGKDHREKK